MMNCPQCGLYLEAANTASCPRCGQPIAGSAPANPGGYGPGMDAYSQSPTMLSSGSVSPGAGVPGESYGFAFPGQSMHPATPETWPGAPSSSVPPAYMPPPPPGGYSPLPPIPTPPRKSRSGLITGILLVLIVLLVGGLGISLYALNTRNQPEQTGASGTTPAASPTLPPTPTSSETILFQDPLTSNTNGWGDSNGHCFFQNNAYHIKNNYICYAPAGDITDANVTVQAEQVAGSLLYPYGIVFRRTSTGNWYEFDIDSNSKWTFVKTVNGTTTTLIDYTLNTAIKGGLNTVNTLLVKIKGTHFTFFVNGTQVGQADDSTFASGLTGLSAGGNATEVAYTNFEIDKASS